MLKTQYLQRKEIFLNKKIIYISENDVTDTISIEENQNHIDATKKYIEYKNLPLTKVDNNHLLCSYMTIYNICTLTIEGNHIVCYLPFRLNEFQYGWFKDHFSILNKFDISCLSRTEKGFQLIEYSDDEPSKVITRVYKEIKRKYRENKKIKILKKEKE